MKINQHHNTQVAEDAYRWWVDYLSLKERSTLRSKYKIAPNKTKNDVVYNMYILENKLTDKHSLLQLETRNLLLQDVIYGTLLSTKLKVKEMNVIYLPVEEHDGVYITGGYYALELQTESGTFYQKLHKAGEEHPV